MTVRFIPVKNRLSQLIRRPGGVRVEKALAEAEAALDSLREAAMTTVDNMLAELEHAVATRDAAVTPERIYDLSSNVLDVAGFFEERALCEAAYSLCDLADRQRGMAIDWSGVGVHVQALRLIRQARITDPRTLQPMMDGLKAVAARAGGAA